MNAKNIVTIALAAVAVLFALDFLVRKTGGDIAESIAEINQDTPFAGTGVVGTVGNITNKLSGGTLAQFGSFLGLQGSKAINFFRTGEFR